MLIGYVTTYDFTGSIEYINLESNPSHLYVGPVTDQVAIKI